MTSYTNTMSKLLSIIVPVYNEEVFVVESLKRLVHTNIPGWEKEIIVVDDGSTDKSHEEVKKFIRDNPLCSIILLRHSQNKGKGSAIKTAIKKATGNILVIQDADLEYDPVDISSLLDKYTDTTISAVYGSRIKGARIYHSYTAGPLFYFGGITLTFMTNQILKTKLTDQPTCYKSWRSNLNNALVKFSKKNGFEFEIEMTALFARNGRIEETPIHYYPRSTREGKKINFLDFLKSAITLFECALCSF